MVDYTEAEGQKAASKQFEYLLGEELLPYRLMILTAKFTSGIWSRNSTDYLRDFAEYRSVHANALDVTLCPRYRLLLGNPSRTCHSVIA